MSLRQVSVLWGRIILLKHGMTPDDALDCFKAHVNHSPVLIHSGFIDAKGLVGRLGALSKDQCHVFIDDPASGMLYRKHFKGAHRVLVKDGFVKKRNADYSPIEGFSDLHVTFQEEATDGFGDFLIVGDEFSETGGPAYAIAIHLTFIDPDQDNVMKIYDFVSDTQNTPKDPAGKFGEALEKMVKRLNMPGSKILETEAVKEYRSLYELGHFPGLGYVKKLSMNHHIDTLAHYFKTAT